jgi:hypothetical protein
MSVSSPSAATATASQPQSPDIQQLVGLLGSLMPLLLRFQAQAFQSQVFQSQVLEQPFHGGPGNFVMPNPALDRQAAENFISDIIAGSLRTLSAYLEANAGQYAGLESCIPIVTQAAHRFAVRDYAQAFDLIWQAYRAIEMVRVADPRIPPPRTASSDQTSSSIH